MPFDAGPAVSPLIVDGPAFTLLYFMLQRWRTADWTVRQGREVVMVSPDIRECAVCAWRETCRLKWRNEPNGALHCPEFTFDLRLAQAQQQVEKSPRQTSEQEAND